MRTEKQGSAIVRQGKKDCFKSTRLVSREGDFMNRMLEEEKEEDVFVLCYTCHCFLKKRFLHSRISASPFHAMFDCSRRCLFLPIQMTSFCGLRFLSLDKTVRELLGKDL